MTMTAVYEKVLEKIIFMIYQLAQILYLIKQEIA
jgi:hypothetical protein